MVIRHYLDDFWTVSPGDAPAAAERAYTAMRSVCEELGVPLALEKCVAPATRLTLLGLELDTVRLTVALPTDKHEALMDTLLQLRTRQKCLKRELQSLVGRLVHAARCAPAAPGDFRFVSRNDMNTVWHPARSGQSTHELNIIIVL